MDGSVKFRLIFFLILVPCTNSQTNDSSSTEMNTIDYGFPIYLAGAIRFILGLLGLVGNILVLITIVKSQLYKGI